MEAAYRARARSEPAKKAGGGSVVNPRGAMKNLVKVANQLQRALASGNTARVTQLSAVIDGQMPGSSHKALETFARGGSVTNALKKLFGPGGVERRKVPRDQLPPYEAYPNREPDLGDIAGLLERLKPDSEALRQYRMEEARRASPDLRSFYKRVTE